MWPDRVSNPGPLTYLWPGVLIDVELINVCSDIELINVCSLKLELGVNLKVQFSTTVYCMNIIILKSDCNLRVQV